VGLEDVGSLAGVGSPACCGVGYGVVGALALAGAVTLELVLWGVKLLMVFQAPLVHFLSAGLASLSTRWAWLVAV